MDEQLKNYVGTLQYQYNQNNAWSAEQAQKQMDFQERLSNTAHQREVADLKAAGLNPILSAGGSGAAAMTGAAATRSDSNIEAMYGLISKAFDAQIEQAQADKVSARAISGSAGSSAGTRDLSDIAAEDKSMIELLEDAAADFVKKKTGISTETTKEMLDRVLEKGKEVYSSAKRASDIKSAYRSSGQTGVTTTNGKKTYWVEGRKVSEKTYLAYAAQHESYR